MSKVDLLNEHIDKSIKYLSRHFKSKNIFRRILWALLGWKTFTNIVYDCADVFYDRGQKDMKDSNICLRAINKAALTVGLDKTCCGNCKFQIVTCEPIGCTAGMNNTSARDCCRKYEFDQISYQDRLIEKEG